RALPSPVARPSPRARHREAVVGALAGIRSRQPPERRQAFAVRACSLPDKTTCPMVGLVGGAEGGVNGRPWPVGPPRPFRWPGVGWSGATSGHFPARGVDWPSAATQGLWNRGNAPASQNPVLTRVALAARP